MVVAMHVRLTCLIICTTTFYMIHTSLQPQYGTPPDHYVSNPSTLLSRETVGVRSIPGWSQGNMDQISNLCDIHEAQHKIPRFDIFFKKSRLTSNDYDPLSLYLQSTLARPLSLTSSVFWYASTLTFFASRASTTVLCDLLSHAYCYTRRNG